MNRISFLAPLPPAALRSNSRRPWYERTKAKQAYSKAVLAAFSENTATLAEPTPNIRWRVWKVTKPWARARVMYEWRFCGTAPDEQNLGANLKALTDILCRPPNIGLCENNTTYLGLVEDDKGIVPRYAMVKVAHRAETGVWVEIDRIDG